MRRWIAGVALLAAAVCIISVLLWQSRSTQRSAHNGHAAQKQAPIEASATQRTTDQAGPTSARPANGRTANAPASHPADARCERERRVQYKALRDQTDPSASAEFAALHALLSTAVAESLQDHSEVSRELEQATQQWPANAELAWLAHNQCQLGGGCDTRLSRMRLQHADGDNSYAWLPALDAAMQAEDTDGFAETLHRAAHAPVYDTRRGTILLRLRPALQSIPLPAVCATAPGLRALAETNGRPADAALHADLQSLAMEMVAPVPGFRGLGECVKAERALPEPVLQDCRRLLSRIARGDTMIERMVALPKLIAIAPDAGERDAWREQYRTVQWLLTLVREMDRIQGVSWRIFAEGEIGVLEQHARDTGRWPPPSGWLPEDERSRKVLGVGQR